MDRTKIKGVGGSVGLCRYQRFDAQLRWSGLPSRHYQVLSGELNQGLPGWVAAQRSRLEVPSATKECRHQTGQTGRISEGATQQGPGLGVTQNLVSSVTVRRYDKALTSRFLSR